MATWGHHQPVYREHLLATVARRWQKTVDSWRAERRTPWAEVGRRFYTSWGFSGRLTTRTTSRKRAKNRRQTSGVVSYHPIIMRVRTGCDTHYGSDCPQGPGLCQPRKVVVRSLFPNTVSSTLFHAVNLVVATCTSRQTLNSWFGIDCRIPAYRACNADIRMCLSIRRAAYFTLIINCNRWMQNLRYTVHVRPIHHTLINATFWKLHMECWSCGRAGAEQIASFDREESQSAPQRKLRIWVWSDCLQVPWPWLHQEAWYESKETHFFSFFFHTSARLTTTVFTSSGGLDLGKLPCWPACEPPFRQ